MKNTALLVLLFAGMFHVTDGRSQSSLKADSVCMLVRKHFNSKDVNALYSLTGNAFRKAIPASQFREICSRNLFPLGEMPVPQLVGQKAGVYRYKVDFSGAALALFLSLDSNDKLETFLLKEFEPEPGLRTEPVATNNPRKSALDKKVHEAVQDYMMQASATGLSIGILEGNKMRFYGYGETARNSRKIPGSTTLFEIGSITKTFTGILLARAIHEGKMRPDEPVNRYLPPSIPLLQYNGVPVNIGMLSNHSSGLPRMPDNFTAVVTDPKNPYRNYSRAHAARHRLRIFESWCCLIGNDTGTGIPEAF
jgi:CubicO group peptidase (beta-lactamase class C family)